MNIQIDLFDSGSVKKACDELTLLIDKLEALEAELPEKLVETGKAEAEPRFQNAMYAGTNDVSVRTEDINKGKRLTAEGASVAFIEFGTGVGMGRGYPGTRPDGIVGLGEWGAGHGSHPPWTYKGELGSNPPHATYAISSKPDVVRTYGNPPAAGMAAASAEMRVQLESLVKEALK